MNDATMGETPKPPAPLPTLGDLARRAVEGAAALLAAPDGPRVRVDPRDGGRVHPDDVTFIQGELQGALDSAKLPARVHVTPWAELQGDGTARVGWTLHNDPNRRAAAQPATVGA
jgi:hypothetical protein